MLLAIRHGRVRGAWCVVHGGCLLGAVRCGAVRCVAGWLSSLGDQQQATTQRAISDQQPGSSRRCIGCVSLRSSLGVRVIVWSDCAYVMCIICNTCKQLSNEWLWYVIYTAGGWESEVEVDSLTPQFAHSAIYDIFDGIHDGDSRCEDCVCPTTYIFSYLLIT
jgi:hypothetical protein